MMTRWSTTSALVACAVTVAGCNGDNGPTGNTELNVIIPTGSTQSGPAAFDIQIVEYTIVCDDGIDFDPTSDPD
ncbi:MAG: hypothetical protein WBG86_06860, partial [Polyangiales bacterium]